MRRLLASGAVFVVLLLLGVAAVMARPGTAAPTLSAEAALSARAIQGVPANAAAPQSPAVTPKWNAVAVPLSNTTALPNAQALADAIPGTQQVLSWNPATQRFIFYVPTGAGGPAGTNFVIGLGKPYMVQVGASSTLTFTLVGDVPPQSGQPGAVQFSMVGGIPNCKWTYISLPLDKGAITTAQQLADAISTPNVQQLLSWNATTQRFIFYVPSGAGGPAGTNFATKIGYPYFVCLSAAVTWP